MAYNRRDLIGHWVTKTQSTQKPCTHACCRGFRVHPSNYPVILADRTLHRASEKDLMTHWAKVQNDDSAKGERARAQLLAEMQRRDDKDARRLATQQRYRERLVARKFARSEELERSWLQAEHATRGNMLNRAGRENQIDERSLFTGPESRVRRYGSEELLNYFAEHPRPTSAHFAGRDTRLGAVYSAPRRREYGVRPARATSPSRGARRPLAGVR